MRRWIRVLVVMIASVLALAVVPAAPAAEARVIGSGYDAYCTVGTKTVSWTGKEEKDCAGWLNVYYKGSFAYQLNAGYMDSAERRKCDLYIAVNVVTIFVPAKNIWLLIAKGLSKATVRGLYPSCNWKSHQ